MNTATLFEEPVSKSAFISDCGAYRYWLRRDWSAAKWPAIHPDVLVFVMLNPSTADAELDDPTIRRCVGFAKREECAGVAVINLYAGRATEPDNLFRMDDPSGPENVNWWHTWLRPNTNKIVCAWGADSRARPQARKFLKLAAEYGGALWCLGLSKDGSPRHPLYLRADAPLQRFGVTSKSLAHSDPASSGLSIEQSKPDP